MMTDIEKARLLIEQNARLIDKQNLDEGMESLSQGQQHCLIPVPVRETQLLTNSSSRPGGAQERADGLERASRVN